MSHVRNKTVFQKTLIFTPRFETAEEVSFTRGKQILPVSKPERRANFMVMFHLKQEIIRIDLLKHLYNCVIPKIVTNRREPG
jgi:hypothetical protein